MADWNPAAYGRFRDLRLRPALDLMGAVGDLPAAPIVDLGCGNGAAAAALRARFPGRALIGVDASAAMLAAAQGYDAQVQADIAAWAPATPPALIFSNAALHWLGDHDRLLPRLVGWLAPGGWLAVQMPANWLEPSHALLRATATRLFPDRFPPGPYTPPVRPLADYLRLLAPLGTVEGWETTYHQRLAPALQGHPVRAFTQSTAMRPFLDALDRDQGAALTAAYDAALEGAYRPEEDGSVLFPFRRLFFTLKVP